VGKIQSFDSTPTNITVFVSELRSDYIKEMLTTTLFGILHS